MPRNHICFCLFNFFLPFWIFVLSFPVSFPFFFFLLSPFSLPPFLLSLLSSLLASSLLSLLSLPPLSLSPLSFPPFLLVSSLLASFPPCLLSPFLLSPLSLPPFLLSSVRHASDESALPHPQKPGAEAQVKEVVSVLKAFQSLYFPPGSWTGSVPQVQEVPVVHRELPGEEPQPAAEHRAAAEAPLHQRPAQRAAGPNPAEGPHWPDQEEAGRERWGSDRPAVTLQRLKR